MTTTTPDIATHIRDFFLKHIVTEHNLTRALINMVPADQLEYRPPKAQRSVSDLMWYLVQYEDNSLSAICDGQFGPPVLRPEADGAEAVLAWDEEHFAKTVARLAELSGEDLLRPLEIYGSNIPAVEFLPMYLSAALQSRGHLAVYLMQTGALESAAHVVDSLHDSGSKGAEASPREDDALEERELAAVAGGVTVVGHYTNQTAAQMGWIAPPPTQATLGSLMTTNDPKINNIMGILSGAFLGAAFGFGAGAAGAGVSIGNALWNSALTVGSTMSSATAQTLGSLATFGLGSLLGGLTSGVTTAVVTTQRG